MTWSNVRGAAMTLEHAVTIGAATETVWALLADPTAMPRWFPGVERVVITSQQQSGPDVRRTVYYAGGRQTDEEVLTWHPEEGYAYAILRGMPFWTHRATFRLTPQPDGVQVAWTYQFEAAIPDRQLGPLLAHLEMTMTQGLANLKRLVEGK